MGPPAQERPRLLRLAAVLPAAGQGRRLGEDKALVDLGGEPAIARTAAACRAGWVERIVVVRAAGAAPLPDDLPIEVVEVAPGAEMIDSVRAGVRALDHYDALVLWPVDHAMACGDTLRALVRHARAAAAPAVTLPLFDGRPGHPILLPAGRVAAILDPAHATMRDVVRSGPVDAVPVRDPWILRDLDTPDDLSAARERLRDLGRTTVEVMRNHRSRRAYRPDPIPMERLSALVDAARHASTSSFIQAYAVVAVTDIARKTEAARLCADQDHIRQAPVFLAICADLHKIERACARHGLTFDPLGTEGFLQATVDAALLGQNLLLAAEAEGLGGCMIGAARNHPIELGRLLELPAHAFVVFGMTLGVPGDDPIPRGRMPLDGVLFHERYDDSVLDAVLDGADVGVRAWAVACNQHGGLAGKPVDVRRAWSDRVAAQWSKEKARPTPRQQLRAHLEELGLRLL
ncbi:MAG: NTP transferase domain-containing protein [Planctomycetota bacterium]